MIDTRIRMINDLAKNVALSKTEILVLTVTQSPPPRTNESNTDWQQRVFEYRQELVRTVGKFPIKVHPIQDATLALEEFDEPVEGAYTTLELFTLDIPTRELRERVGIIDERNANLRTVLA